MLRRTSAFGGFPLTLHQSMTLAPRVSGLEHSISTRTAAFEQRRGEEIGGHGRVVERTAGPSILGAVEALVPLQQVIEGGSHRRPCSPQGLQPLVGDQHLVGAVQRDHGDGRAAREDLGCCLRVDVEIELGGRGDVASLRHGSAHQHDTGEMLC